MNKTFWIIILLLIGGGIWSAANNSMNNEINNNIIVSNPGEFSITPIEHATMILNWKDKAIYTDPVDASKLTGQPEPDLVLLTDIHGDHLKVEALQAVVKEKTVIVAPQAVVDQIKVDLPGTIIVLNNGEKTTQQGFSIEAVPMYNYPETEDSRHVKGRGNGYVVEADGKRIYIAGDTGNIIEARDLENIEHAFVPMNLPFTMSVEEAAQMVLAMKPKTVTPYHYRGQDGLADTQKFRDLVNKGDPEIKVDLIDFYPNTP